MDVGVLLHVRLLVKPLAAILTGVRPRVRVDQEVGAECARPFEGFAALLALLQQTNQVVYPGFSLSSLSTNTPTLDRPQANGRTRKKTLFEFPLLVGIILL